jgi:7-keto-8-aminopelargonate synthetase-like enzyme
MMGRDGRGTADAQGVQDQVDVYFGTFAKAMATIGAFISGPEDMMMYMRYNMRSQTVRQEPAHADRDRRPEALGDDPHTAGVQ